MAVLNTDVNAGGANTDALGLGVPEFDAPQITPEKVLWHAIQQEDVERKRSQAASRQALSELNDIKINGWANHLTELNQRKNDLLTKASNYLQKYRGKSWTEFDPRNKAQAKEALDIQQQLSQLKEMENFSEQVKQWHTADVNAYKGKEDKIDTDSIKENTDFYNKPLSESYKQFASEGDRPMLKEAYPEWQTKMFQTAKTIEDNAIKTVTDNNGMVIGHSFKGVDPQTSQSSFEGFLTTPEGQYGLKDLQRKGMPPDQVIPYVKKLWDARIGQSTSSSVVPDAEGKKKQEEEWQTEGSTIKNKKNIWSVYRRDDGTIEVTINHTDPSDNKPLTFAIGNDNPISVTGTPLKIVQAKGNHPELYLSVPKGYDYRQLTTKDGHVHLVSEGKDADIIKVPYDDFADTIKGEYGSGNMDFYQALQKVKGKVGATSTDDGGGSTHKASGSKGKPKTVKQNGVTYTLNKKTGEYE